VSDTYKQTEKNADCCHFQGQGNLNFCNGKFLLNQIVLQLYSVHSEKLWYVESCLERDPKGIANFPTSTSTQDTTPREETIGRAVPLEGGFPVLCLQVSVSRPPTVYGRKDYLRKYDRTIWKERVSWKL
jgi:hypothetical protein